MTNTSEDSDYQILPGIKESKDIDKMKSDLRQTNAEWNEL